MCARLSSLNRYIEDPHADDTIFRIQPFFAQNQKNGLGLAKARQTQQFNNTRGHAKGKGKGKGMRGKGGKGNRIQDRDAVSSKPPRMCTWCPDAAPHTIPECPHTLAKMAEQCTRAACQEKPAHTRAECTTERPQTGRRQQGRYTWNNRRGRGRGGGKGREPRDQDQPEVNKQNE